MSAERKALVALVGLTTLSLFWLVDSYFESMWDAALYVLTTRSLLAGEGYTVYGHAFDLRPPGFSFLLAPVMAVFGTNFLALNVFVSLLGILALALLFLYLRPRLGIAVSLAACGALWVNPQYQSLCNATLSDTVGLAGVLGCLLLERRARRAPSIGNDLLVGLAIGLTGYLRTIGFLLVPAILLGRLFRSAGPAGDQGLRRKLARGALLLAVVIATQLPWSLWKRSHPAPYPPVYHGIHSYWTAQWQQDPANRDSQYITWDDLRERVELRFGQCLTSLGSRMPKATLQGMLGNEKVSEVRSQNRRPFGFLLGCVGVASLAWVASRRRDPGSLFALGNLAVCLVYFDFDDRLVLPIHVFALAAFLELLLGLVRKRCRPRLATVLVVALVSWMGVSDAFPRNDRSVIARRNRANSAVARFVQERYPEQIGIGGSLGHKLAVFFDRPVHFLEVAASKRNREGLQGNPMDIVADRGVKVFIHTGSENGWIRWELDKIARRLRLAYRVDEVCVYEYPVPGLPEPESFRALQR